MMYTPKTALDRKIHELMIDPAVRKVKTGAYGTIIYYNPNTRLACVRTRIDGAAIVLEDIIIQDGSGGVIATDPKPGDKAFITFTGSKNPYISAVFESSSLDRRKIDYGPQIPRILGVI